MKLKQALREGKVTKSDNLAECAMLIENPHGSGNFLHWYDEGEVTIEDILANDWEPYIEQFSAVTTNKGIVLCDKVDGAFLVLRSVDDLERLRRLINSLAI